MFHIYIVSVGTSSYEFIKSRERKENSFKVDCANNCRILCAKSSPLTFDKQSVVYYQTDYINITPSREAVIPKNICIKYGMREIPNFETPTRNLPYSNKPSSHDLSP